MRSASVAGSTGRVLRTRRLTKTLCASKGMDHINYHYDELLKLLIIMASDPNIQLEAYGLGNAEEEMAIDLESHFAEHRNELVKCGYLSSSEANAISEIDCFLEIRSNPENEPFWRTLETHPDWVVVRKMASDTLNQMGKEDLTVTIEVKNKRKNWSRKILAQQVKIELVRNDT